MQSKHTPNSTITQVPSSSHLLTFSTSALAKFVQTVLKYILNRFKKLCWSITLKYSSYELFFFSYELF